VQFRTSLADDSRSLPASCRRWRRCGHTSGSVQCRTRSRGPPGGETPRQCAVSTVDITRAVWRDCSDQRSAADSVEPAGLK